MTEEKCRHLGQLIHGRGWVCMKCGEEYDNIKKKRINVSYSALSTYKASPRLWYYSYLMQMEPDTETMTCYGEAGGALHKAIELYIKEGKDPEQTLKDVWAEKEIFKLIGFGGRYLSIDPYLICVKRAKGMVDEYKSAGHVLKSEVYFRMEHSEHDNIIIKGFVDLELVQGQDITLVDWKTNSGVVVDHQEQARFYAYLYWKQFGTIPKCHWVYLKIGSEPVNHIFSEADLRGVERQIEKFLAEVFERGFDEEKYPVGDWQFPFNEHQQKFKKATGYDERWD